MGNLCDTKSIHLSHEHEMAPLCSLQDLGRFNRRTNHTIRLHPTYFTVAPFVCCIFCTKMHTDIFALGSLRNLNLQPHVYNFVHFHPQTSRI